MQVIFAERDGATVSYAKSRVHGGKWWVFASLTTGERMYYHFPGYYSKAEAAAMAKMLLALPFAKLKAMVAAAV
jgi:hypothetical protein